VTNHNTYTSEYSLWLLRSVSGLKVFKHSSLLSHLQALPYWWY